MATDAVLRRQVIANGWVVLQRSINQTRLAQEVSELGRSLGQVGANRNGVAVEVLKPTASEDAYANSQSARHGARQIPLHTDGAHRLVPPRFIILACVEPSCVSVPTVLSPFAGCPLSDGERLELESAPVTYKNGRRSFHSTIINRDRAFIRFDLGCMIFPDCRSEAVANLFLSRANESKVYAHQWRSGDVLIFDNYSILHGRGDIDQEATADRKLLRVSVQ